MGPSFRRSVVAAIRLPTTAPYNTTYLPTDDSATNQWGRMQGRKPRLYLTLRRTDKFEGRSRGSASEASLYSSAIPIERPVYLREGGICFPSSRFCCKWTLRTVLGNEAGWARKWILYIKMTASDTTSVQIQRHATRNQESWTSWKSGI